MTLTPREAREAARCAQLYVVERLSCREIGRRLTMHPATVRKNLDRAGVPREKGRHLRTDAAVIAAICALSAEGLTQREIGARLGRSHPTVGRWQPRLRTAQEPNPANDDGRDAEETEGGSSGAVASQERL